jgi:uncharacterized protein YndB with AHSA1/START domain
MSNHHVVYATRVIHAPASTIFDVLADARQHARFDGSGSVQEVKSAPARLYLGASFNMKMKIGIKYVTKNKVIAFEEARNIAWWHFAHFEWRYELEEAEEGTRVNESFNYNKPWAFAIIAMGIPAKNQRAMEASLERLEKIVTS